MLERWLISSQLPNVQWYSLCASINLLTISLNPVSAYFTAHFFIFSQLSTFGRPLKVPRNKNLCCYVLMLRLVDKLLWSSGAKDKTCGKFTMSLLKTGRRADYRDFCFQLFIFLFLSFANLVLRRWEFFFHFLAKHNYRPLNNFQEENVFDFLKADETL